MPAKKTPAAKKAPGPIGQLVPQNHPKGFKGAIWQGKAKNHKPGKGRPPEAIRTLMRGTLDEILPGLIDKYQAGSLDALRFADFLAKYALGTKEEITVVSPDLRDRIARMVETISTREVWPREELLDTIAPFFAA